MQPLLIMLCVDDPQNNYATWKEPVTKNHFWCDFVYGKCAEQANPYRLKADQSDVPVRILSCEPSKTHKRSGEMG